MTAFIVFSVGEWATWVALLVWAYDERGCLAWVTELWDIFARLEIARPDRFID